MKYNNGKIVGRFFSKQKYCDNPESYAYALSIYKIIWVFVIGSFLGFVVETGYYYFLRGYFINRQGLVLGPFSPIYGVGAVLITVVLYKIRFTHPLYVSIISGICGGLFEYFCSVLQEKVLGTRSWDYTGIPFNINGRTSLKFMIFWGILGFIFIRYSYPYFSKCIENIPEKLGKAIAILVVIFMIFDCLLSLGATVRQKYRRYGAPATNAVAKFFDEYYPDDKLNKIYTEVSVVDSKSVHSK